ncbi:LysM peptidoglycan-binding domain-containing protein [bacterium]|nr:MAG: LysM peptidoglycan-binding domain-containing protein [bacterium]
MLQKSKIRLSRSLHAQTTPYPEVGRWIRRGFFIFIILVGVGIYAITRPHGQKSPQTATTPDTKQILGEQQQEPQYQTYEIKKGDTLFNLSNRFSVPWRTIADVNHLQSPYILKIGQKIKIPSSN